MALPQTQVETHSIFEGLVNEIQTLFKVDAPYERVKELLEDFSPSKEDLVSYSEFGEIRYKRNLVFRSDQFEILVLCWKPGQASPVHNHRGSWCGVKVISGIATEIIFQETPSGTWVPASREQVLAGSVTSSYDTDTHIIGNFHKQDLISVHCYTPPLADYDIVPYGQTIAVALHSSYSTMGPEVIINQH